MTLSFVKKATGNRQQATAPVASCKALGAVVALAVLLCLAGAAQAERIKDIADIKGVRANPIWGYGIVIGLNGTGDDSPITRQALASLLRKEGINLTPEQVASKNIASVMVTSQLPAFGRSGKTIDVTVSALGSASSLQGGTLLITPLKGADSQVYAVAQGSVSIGGFSASGENASISKNHPTVGRIPNGANIEKEELACFVEDGQITIQLHNPDFSTAESTAKVINTAFPDSARTVDGGTITVDVPKKMTKAEVVGYLEKIQALEVKVDQPAMVVINERTGTVIVGENVMISTVAISHGNLAIVTKTTESVSQPGPFAPPGAKTEKTADTSIKAIEDKGALQVIQKQVSVAELAKALNAMGLTPRDLIAIFEALRDAGALQAQLKIM